MSREGFGDSSVLGDTRWGGAYGVEATFIAMDTVTVSYIYTKDIEEILNKDPALYSVKRTFARHKRIWLANAHAVSETWRKVSPRTITIRQYNISLSSNNFRSWEIFFVGKCF